MKTLILKSLLHLVSVFQNEIPINVSEVSIFECQTTHGFSTNSALSNFTKLNKSCALRQCTLNNSDYAALSNMLSTAKVKKHHQSKIGQDLFFTVFLISGQKHDFIVNMNYYLLDLTDRKEYFINSLPDRSLYDTIFKKIVNK